mmetsp:Transcript_102364/g.289490  ORF Transcript_102364/g.289490 Transcript_102364/m.289490 type:complete len:222 (+) Transcript_102364:869-1534(+)
MLPVENNGPSPGDSCRYAWAASRSGRWALAPSLKRASRARTCRISYSSASSAPSSEGRREEPAEVLWDESDGRLRTERRRPLAAMRQRGAAEEALCVEPGSGGSGSEAPGSGGSAPAETGRESGREGTRRRHAEEAREVGVGGRRGLRGSGAGVAAVPSRRSSRRPMGGESDESRGDGRIEEGAVLAREDLLEEERLEPPSGCIAPGRRGATRCSRPPRRP